MELTVDDKLKRLEACRKVRNIAAQTCTHVLQETSRHTKKISELNFRNRWAKELEKNYTKGFTGCWYDPPPLGISVLFAREKKPERINYPNLRQKVYWPQPKNYLDKKGCGYLFASPYTFIDAVPIIGDFGFTYYLGKSRKIIDHYKKCMYVQNSITGSIKVGMTFKDVYEKTSALTNKNNLENNVYSVTDKSWTNIGHTVPFIERELKKEEKDAINSEDPDRIHKVISQARIFINQNEDYQITENCAFTVEPRFTSSLDKSLPMCCFHTIVQFIGGKKEVLTNFEGIFNLLGMDWIKE